MEPSFLFVPAHALSEPARFEHAKWLDEVKVGERIRFPQHRPLLVTKMREDGGLISVIGVDDQGNEHIHTSYGFQGVFLVEEIPDSPPLALS